MDAFTIYKYASSGFLILQSIPLILNPSGLIVDLTPKPSSSVPVSKTGPTPTVVEKYFARFAGLTSLSLAGATLVMTNSLGFLGVDTGVSSGAGVLGSSVVATSTKTAAIMVGSGYLGSIAALAGYHTVATGNQQYMFHAIVGSVLSSLGAYCLYSS